MSTAIAKPPSTHIDDERAKRIPLKLRRVDRWVVWRWELRDGSWTKPPINPLTGKSTDATNPDAWMPFDKARILACNLGDGIGIALGPEGNRSGLVGVDFDHCIDDQGHIDPTVLEIVENLRSYTEFTPTCHGLRTMLWGEKPGDKCRKKGCSIEIYDRDRYFTVSGQVFTGPGGIAYDNIADDREQGNLNVLYAELFGANGKHQGNGQAFACKPVDASDEELLNRARSASNGGEFSALYDRGEDVHGDDSANDMALMNHLAFWVGRDFDRIERMFSASALGQREKWQKRGDYRERTINKAIADCSSVYTPRPKLKSRAKSSGNGRQIKVIEAANDPHRLGRIFLKNRCEHQGERTLVYHKGELHLWEGSAYRPFPDHEANAITSKVAKQEFDRLNRLAIEAWEHRGRRDEKDKECLAPVAQKVGTRLIGDIGAAIRGETLLSGTVEPPCWLIDNPPFPAADVLPTLNALVHLPSFVAGKAGAIAKPTPVFFCPYALDYGFNHSPPVPQAWIDFLVSVWPSDPECINTLQEWMGYLLTLDTRQQKIAMLIGPPRSGRGTISRVIGGLVGPANVANPTFASLAAHFGAECLIGKPVSIIGDARQSHRSDWAIALERLLMISGEDAMTIDRKNRPDWTGRLPTRLVLISNELPRFSDSSGALAARLLLFQFTESFLGREDRALDAKLRAELPGILLWAIEGWKRLRDRGHFLQPKSGQDLIDQMRDLSSPVGAFVREKCEVKAGKRIARSDLFQAWKDWCVDRNREPGSDEAFGRNLRTVCPHLGMTQPCDAQGRRYRAYEGIGLQPQPTL
jgi:putative DNA primase/helicase